jgi:hypothetical protein
MSDPSELAANRMSTAEAISISLRTFVCGMFGLLPVVGLFPGLYAMYCWSRVHGCFRQQWNPAAPYLVAGLLLGTIGLILSTILILLLIGSIMFA